MITKELSEATTEVNKILSYLPVELVEKVPIKLREYFNEIESKEYIPDIDPYKAIDEQELKAETKTLLTVIYRNYWCNEEERKRLNETLIKNDKKYEEDLRKKYNPDNIFKRKEEYKKIETVEQTKLIIPCKKSWYRNMLLSIKNIFKNKIRGN